MSKKAPLDMSGLLARKGQGTPANDAPLRPVEAKAPVDETTNRRKFEPEENPEELVNLGFKVPRAFRKRIRLLAAQRDLSMVEVLRQAVELYEQS